MSKPLGFAVSHRSTCRCLTCLETRIAAGSPADPPRPVAPAVPVVPAPVATPTRARNWRCPNPRDCGDPTCDGQCGY